MSKITAVSMLLCLMYFPVRSNSHASKSIKLFNQGTIFLKTGNYKRSIVIFDVLRKEGLRCPEVYNNLGIAHYKSGNFNLAISNYERSLLLAPFDKTLIANRNIALEKIGKIETKEFYNYKYIIDRTLLGVISMLFVCSIYFLFSSARLIPFSFGLSYATQKINLIICCVACIILSVIMTRFNDSTHAIVIEDNVIGRTGPSISANKAFDLEGGVKVKVLKSFKEWQKVQLVDGNRCWILNKVINNIRE